MYLEVFAGGITTTSAAATTATGVLSLTSLPGTRDTCVREKLMGNGKEVKDTALASAAAAASLDDDVATGISGGGDDDDRRLEL
jgi:hypothetical protein